MIVSIVQRELQLAFIDGILQVLAQSSLGHGVKYEIAFASHT